MAEDLNFPEGVTVPVWYKRLMEARATTAGPANIPPPTVAPDLPPPPPPRTDTFAKTCKEFKAMGGKPFQGSETFVEARDWLKETEELIDIFEMEEGKKVKLAAWLMKGEASFWWEVTNGERLVDSWADFRQRFVAKFLSRAEENLYMERFLTLKQGNLSVKEYVNQYNQLARFGIDMVYTPEKKALRFVKGLNEPMHGLAMTHIPMGATFEKLVDMALMHEEENGPNANKAPEKKGDQKRPQQQQQNKGGKGNGGKGKKKCFNYGIPGHISKDCRKKKKTGCYHCGEAGHLVKDCPKKGQRTGSTSGGQVQALMAPGQARGKFRLSRFHRFRKEVELFPLKVWFLYLIILSVHCLILAHRIRLSHHH